MARVWGKVQRWAGLSLMETVLALFLLLGGFALLLESYSRSLGYASKVDRNTEAALFAQTVSAQIDAWAADPAHYAQPVWSEFSTVEDPDFPGFQARARVTDASMPSPCSDLELDRPVDEQVVMRASSRRVELEVFHQGTRVLGLGKLVGEPRRTPDPTNPLVVTELDSLVVARDGELRLQAELRDTSGGAIADVEFRWSIQPGTGNATIERVSRDGRTAVLKNVYRPRTGPELHTGGRCQVSAVAIYWGREYKGFSAEVELQP